MATREKPGPAAETRVRGAPTALATVLVIHGPNLNLLGQREPEIYGRTRLGDIDRALKELGRELSLKVETFQSNSEGAIVDRIQRARGRARALVINPAAYTHTSVAIRDAITACDLPTVEVHLSNIAARETFRQTSITAGACKGQISGFGTYSYQLGLLALKRALENEPPRENG